MNILITGGCGFLGARLTRTLLAGGPVAWRGGAAQAPSRASRWPTACRHPPTSRPTPASSSCRATCCEQAGNGALPLAGTDAVFHLAAAVSGECEADFDLGMRSNLDTTRALLDACRRARHAPVFVFASSVAVFGDSPGSACPWAVIEDTTCRRRRTATASRSSSASSWWPTSRARASCRAAMCGR
jgi:nucleoside-diphosphate-sugar epimerase